MPSAGMARLKEELGVSVEPAFQLGDGDELAPAAADYRDRGGDVLLPEVQDTRSAAQASATLSARRGAGSAFMVVKPRVALCAQTTSLAGPIGSAGATECATDWRP